MTRGTLTLAAVAGVLAVAAGVTLATTGGSTSDPAAARAQVPAPLASGRLELSRRSDPSLDRYVRTARRHTPARRLTDGQRWLSQRASPVVMHDSDPRVSLNAVGWASRPNVAAYVNATGVNEWRAPMLRGARQWLVSSGGQPVKVDGWRMLDIREPAARRWWLYGADGRASCHPERDLRGALDLLACGYRGLWVDNVLTVPEQWFKPKPDISAASWGEGIVALLTELRAAMPSGTQFVINAHWTDTDFGWQDNPALDPSSAYVRAAQLADQLVIEGGAIDPGLDYAAPSPTAWSYRRLLAFGEAAHAQGIRLQWEKTSSSDLTANAAQQLGRLPSCRDGDYARPQPAWKQGSPVWRAHVRTAAFNYASALLVAAAGDGAGDMCEYPGRGWAGYAADLGAPLGPRSGAGPLLTREFARGVVAVNPSSEPQPFTLPGGRRGVDLASRRWPQPTAPTSLITLPPRTAAVVAYP